MAEEDATRTERRPPASAGDDARPRPHRGLQVTERVRLVDPLEKGGQADVWTADHSTLGIQVAVKFLRRAGNETLRQRFSREAQLAARMDHPHAVRIFDHGLTEDGTPFIVMELVDGESLAHRIRRAGAMRPELVVEIVDQVAQVLAAAHRMSIVHRDVKPHNVMLLSTERLHCKVLDFGLAKPLEVDTTVTEAGWLLGTPAYMAPEQLIEAQPATPHSDGWGLAVLAYEALTGKLPFSGQHAAIGLAMILGRYTPVSELRPELPPSIDEWFRRAFAVDPAQRFDSIGMLAETFASALSGARSVSAPDGRLRIPAKIYGRDDELAALDDAYSDVAAGGSRLVLVKGYPGVGKTALVDAARTRFSDRGAIFVDGKFDQFNRGTPYDSLLQAFRKLMRYVARRENASVETWRDRLQDAVGDVGQLLTEVIPELETIIGPQPVLAETTPSEARARFQNAVTRFVRGVATPERPLVMFLDDLQWADLPSIDLLVSLASEDAPHVLVIGAYRDTEVGSGHPLRSAIQKIEEQGSQVPEIHLGPLGEDAVLELLTDVLGPGSGRVRLAVMCHDKTQGNPFFLRRLLESLHEDGLLTFDGESGGWSWSSTKIRTRPVGEDVVEFIAAEMARLSDDARAALTRAACIGHQFELGTLAYLLQVDRRTALEALRPSFESDFILPASDEVFELGPQRVAFRFSHDRIQQAARSLVDDGEAALAHRRVAQFMLEHLDESERESRLFELVEHLNRGSDDAVEASDAELRKMNLSAARRAARSAAFEPAHEYYQKALALTDESLWEDDYAEALAIHVEAARSAYLNGEREAMDRLVDIAVSHARNGLDAVEAREVKIHALISEQRFADAVALAVEVLAELGVDLPSAPTQEDVGRVVGETLARLEKTSLDEIVALPLASNPRVVAAQRIKQGVMSAAYVSMPNLLPFLTCSIVEETLDHGIATQSAYGFAVLGMVMNAAMLIDVSYETGRIALALLERVGDRSILAKTRHIVRAHINPFVEPIRESIEHERGIFQLGMDTGDLEYAAWALHIMVAHSVYAGTPLEGVVTMAAEHREVLERTQQLPALMCTLPYQQIVDNARGEVAEPAILKGPRFDEEAHEAALREVDFRGALFISGVIRTFARFLFRDVAGARSAADGALPYADGAIATYHQVWIQQYRCLAVLASSPSEEDLESVRASLDVLRAWASFSEVNHAHRVSLVEAELARVEGRDGDALAGYDAAVEAARKGGFAHEEGIANELAARYYLAKGSKTAARAYLLEAREAYATWGATGKLAHLDDELGDVLEGRKR